MIDHIIISVSNLETSKAFYRKALAAIGYETSPEYISGSTKTKGVGFGGEDLEFFIVHGPVIKPPFQYSVSRFKPGRGQGILQSGDCGRWP